MHNRNNKTYFPDSCEDYIPDLAYSKNSINLIYYDDEWVSQKPREWSRGCGRWCQMPVRGQYTGRHSCRWGARYPSGSLLEGTGHRRPSCCWVTLPSLPPEHSPIPESLIESGSRPLTSHFPGHITETYNASQWRWPWNGQTTPQAQLWAAFFVESLLLQECPCLSQVWTQLICVEPPDSWWCNLFCFCQNSQERWGKVFGKKAPSQPGSALSPCTPVGFFRSLFLPL